MAQNIPRGTPARILLIFALLTGVVVVSAWRDALQRDPVADVRHPTALGDTRFYTPGQGPIRIEVDGRWIELREAPGPPVARADERMFRLPTRTGRGFALYSDREEFSAVAGDADEPPVFGRCGPGAYLRLLPSLAAGPADDPDAPDPPGD